MQNKCENICKVYFTALYLSNRKTLKTTNTLKTMEKTNLTQSYRIVKSYEGFPSRTDRCYATGLTREEAENEILGLKSLWSKGTGRVAECTSEHLTVLEEDDREIYFDIEE